MSVTVIGAGLAGCEAAWQLVKRGIPVTLVEQKPLAMSEAHHSELFAELVCSNSLRSDRIQNAVGLLKEEMRRMDSLILAAADKAKVPAGGALAVDRDTFSGFITDALRKHPLITVVAKEAAEIPPSPAIIATGPLTSDAMSRAIREMPEVSTLHFFDAAAPIVTADSLNMDKVFRASRYGRGDDYLNCPLSKEEYDAFMEALLAAETAPVHAFEKGLNGEETENADVEVKKVFEGCMPVEVMARRGHMVLAFGPMKPVGLPDPRTGKEPYAVVQLRQDDAAGTLFNLVGFQTRLKFPEQRRVFGLIPGLENAEFARYGVMHRNTFLNSPGFLDSHYQVISRPGLYFAGQMTGVEGYVESAASGMVAGISMALQQKGLPPLDFSRETALGALAHYVSTPNRDFQPMNVTYGILDSWPGRIRNKQQRYEKIAERALERIEGIKAQEQALSESAAPAEAQ